MRASRIRHRERAPGAEKRRRLNTAVPLVHRVRNAPWTPDEFDGLPAADVTPDVAHWAEAIATGVLSPLEGFQSADEIEGVLRECALPDGQVWSEPIVFAPADDAFPDAAAGQDIVLRAAGEPFALFHFEDSFAFDRHAFAERLLGSLSERHPGVRYLLSHFGNGAYAGKVTLLRRLSWGPLEPWRMEPAEARGIFAERRWRTVVAFQTTNPPHRAYEYMHRTVLELFDGLFLHPVVDTVRPKYSPLSILKAYQTLIDHYYRPDRVVLGAWQTKMFFAGPREALHHAIVRRNFGCTHILIGRRHADTDGFYEPDAARRIFDGVDRGRLGIEPLFFREVLYCPRCGGHVTDAVCPHAERESISGSRVRESLKAGQIPPDHAMRPEVAEAVRDSVIV